MQGVWLRIVIAGPCHTKPSCKSIRVLTERGPWRMTTVDMDRMSSSIQNATMVAQHRVQQVLQGPRYSRLSEVSSYIKTYCSAARLVAAAA